MEAWEYGTPGSAAEQIAVVRAIYDAFARRDLEGALAHMAQDVELSLRATGRLADRDGPYRGHDGVRQYFQDATRIWSALTLHADDIRAASGGVVVFGQVTGTVGGQELRRRVLWTWKLRDGLAVAVHASDIGGG